MSLSSQISIACTRQLAPQPDAGGARLGPIGELARSSTAIGRIFALYHRAGRLTIPLGEFCSSPVEPKADTLLPSFSVGGIPELGAAAHQGQTAEAVEVLGGGRAERREHGCSEVADQACDPSIRLFWKSVF